MTGSALILVGHGSTRGGGANPALQAHAAALRARRIFAEVYAAALYGAPSPREAMAAAAASGARDITIAPLFMCEGQFTRTILPRALGIEGSSRPSGPCLRVCEPLGLWPELTALLLRRAGEVAARAGLLPGTCKLLLIAHGSTRDPASQAATEEHAARARAARVFQAVRTAYLDQAPYLAEVLRARTRPAIAVGLFAAGDLHAGTDVPRLIAAHGGPPIHRVDAIGEDPAIPDLVLAQVTAASQEPALA
ncbi:MAG TPA: CbiX/SirB N-terminal domain-containing protein [Kiloniellales bacterium]